MWLFIIIPKIFFAAVVFFPPSSSSARSHHVEKMCPWVHRHLRRFILGLVPTKMAGGTQAERDKYSDSCKIFLHTAPPDGNIMPWCILRMFLRRTSSVFSSTMFTLKLDKECPRLDYSSTMSFFSIFDLFLTASVSPLFSDRSWLPEINSHSKKGRKKDFLAGKVVHCFPSAAGVLRCGGSGSSSEG